MTRNKGEDIGKEKYGKKKYKFFFFTCMRSICDHPVGGKLLCKIL